MKVHPTPYEVSLHECEGIILRSMSPYANRLFLRPPVSRVIDTSRLYRERATMRVRKDVRVEDLGSEL